MALPSHLQKELLCTNCGGQCRFNPKSGGLKCDSCKTVRYLDSPNDHSARKEFDYRAHWPQPDLTTQDDANTHQCQTCGGEVIFTGPSLSERCPYCDGSVVQNTDSASYQAMALIPFAVPRDRAELRAGNWIGRRRAAPSDLADRVAQGRIVGLYAPFWTFDSQEAIQYWAKYTTGSGKRKRTRKTSGKMNITFDDLLAPASPHLTSLIRDGILHDFDPNDLKPYIPGYLAGFAAERHHQTVAQGLDANEKDKRLLIRNRIKKHINKPRVQNIKFNSDSTGIRYRRILLPVWIHHYTYGGKAMKIVVSGIDGRTFGERPFSRWKLLGYSAAATLMVMAFGLIWGAAKLF